MAYADNTGRQIDLNRAVLSSSAIFSQPDPWHHPETPDKRNYNSEPIQVKRGSEARQWFLLKSVLNPPYPDGALNCQFIFTWELSPKWTGCGFQSVWKLNCPIGIECGNIEMQAAYQPDVFVAMPFKVMLTPLISSGISGGAVVGITEELPAGNFDVTQIRTSAGGISGNPVVVLLFQGGAEQALLGAVSILHQQQGDPTPISAGGGTTAIDGVIGGWLSPGNAVSRREAVKVHPVGMECMKDRS